MKLCTAITLIALAAFPAVAHEVRPAYLGLTECAPGEFDVLWKVPALGGAPLAGEDIPHEQPAEAEDADKPLTMPCGCPAPTFSQLSRGVAPVHPLLPEGTKMVAPPRVERLKGAELKCWTIRAGVDGIEGGIIGIHGLKALMMDVLVHITFRDGRSLSRLLKPDAPEFIVRSADAGPAATGYAVLGVEHILFGMDHLLFVLALVIIVRGVGPLVTTITAFTVAHSVTLALATLGFVQVSSAPVEAVIALSIVFVASEIIRSRRGQRGLTERAPWLIAGTFGLLHGFGFAGALSEIGLPANDIPLALFLFNVGVEAGQLAFVAVALGFIALLRLPRLPNWASLMPPYAIGSVAMFWVIERTMSLW